MWHLCWGTAVLQIPLSLPFHPLTLSPALTLIHILTHTWQRFSWKLYSGTWDFTRSVFSIYFSSGLDFHVYIKLSFITKSLKCVSINACCYRNNLHVIMVTLFDKLLVCKTCFILRLVSLKLIIKFRKWLRCWFSDHSLGFSEFIQ